MARVAQGLLRGYSKFSEYIATFTGMNASWSSKIIAKYYLLFLCVNIFLPKIDLGFGSFYLFDFTNALLLLILLFRGKIFVNSLVFQSYLFFLVVCWISLLVGIIHFGFVDSTAVFRLVKFTMFCLFLILPFYIYDQVSTRDILMVIKAQYVFVLVSGLYVIYHMIFFPKSISDYAWGYDNRYRLIGFTSYAIDLEGDIGLVGSTSVSMGVFITFLVLIFFSLYRHTKSLRYLLLALSTLFFNFLTYSRAGILALLISLSYHYLINLSVSRIAKLALGVGSFLIVVITVGIVDSLQSFGTLSKILSFSKDSSVMTRVRMLESGLEYLKEDPWILVSGSGYGEQYTRIATGFDHLEGLLATTLLTSGIFAVILIFLHFGALWYQAKEFSRGNSIQSALLYALRIFVPGWFISALMAGNTFQTDFYFPFIYFLFYVPLFQLSRTDNPARSGTL